MSVEVAAIIPAWNEAERIGAVIEALRPHVRWTIVVDDGSRDGTADAARAAGAEVVRHGARRGKGSAIRTGLEAARALPHRYVLLLDADGQHDPADAPALVRAGERGGYDLVIGTRALPAGGPGAVRYWTNIVGCNILSRWTGIELRDSQSGYRLIRAERLAGLTFDARGFEIETEMLLKLIRTGARVGHVEVRYLPPSRPSRLRPVRDVTRICLSALRYHYMPV